MKREANRGVDSKEERRERQRERSLTLVQRPCRADLAELPVVERPRRERLGGVHDDV